ncbi:MAG: hypothetical protein JWR90_1506 [Marmoricola sp.]|jgi:hypothetical protein|nr:hypothetical protein [Marmoricola sp.]
MDALRAMREAKYARDSASGPTRREAAAAAAGGVPVAPAKPAARKAAAPRSAATRSDTVADPSGARCGHKSMNGRACTREDGHSEKSHRYS